MRYESKDWSLEVPEGWCHESDEDCVTFAHPLGVGAFQVSSYRKDEAVTDEDLRDFAGENPLTAVTLGRLTGFFTRFSEDDTFWSMWWLSAGCQMFHASYNCLLADRGREEREEGEVKSMLESLTPADQTNLA